MKCDKETLEHIIQAFGEMEERNWEWDGLEIERGLDEDDCDWVWVPECSTLGNTMIQLADNYEDHGRDCVYVQTACTYFIPLVKELLKHMKGKNNV